LLLVLNLDAPQSILDGRRQPHDRDRRRLIDEQVRPGDTAARFGQTSSSPSLPETMRNALEPSGRCGMSGIAAQYSLGVPASSIAQPQMLLGPAQVLPGIAT